MELQEVTFYCVVQFFGGGCHAEVLSVTHRGSCTLQLEKWGFIIAVSTLQQNIMLLDSYEFHQPGSLLQCAPPASGLSFPSFSPPSPNSPPPSHTAAMKLGKGFAPVILVLSIVCYINLGVVRGEAQQRTAAAAVPNFSTQ